jgi:hypothetical protein
VDKKHQSKSVDETLIVKIPNQISPHKKRTKKEKKKAPIWTITLNCPNLLKNNSTWKLAKTTKYPREIQNNYTCQLPILRKATSSTR